MADKAPQKAQWAIKKLKMHSLYHTNISKEEIQCRRSKISSESKFNDTVDVPNPDTILEDPK